MKESGSLVCEFDSIAANVFVSLGKIPILVALLTRMHLAIDMPKITF